jgi:hypothetical protein
MSASPGSTATQARAQAATDSNVDDAQLADDHFAGWRWVGPKAVQRSAETPAICLRMTVAGDGLPGSKFVTSS